MNRKMDYDEICRSMSIEEVTSNHRTIKLRNTDLLTVNIRNGANEMFIELGLGLKFGTFMRLKSGLAHLIEHLISNKINERIKDIDGRVISRTHLDTMVLGFSVSYLKSQYIEDDECIEVVDLFNIIIDSIKEACNLDYIKENLENEINIIKSELKMTENDPTELFRCDYIGYLSKDKFMIDAAVGGRPDRMDELNDPEMVKDAMEFLLSSNPRFNLGVPDSVEINTLRLFTYYNYAICDGYREYLNVEPRPLNTNILEENFFKPDYNKIKERKEGDLKIIEIESSDPDNIPRYLMLKPGEISTKEDWIKNVVLTNLLNTIILSDTSSMVWKEFREKGETYGIYNELHMDRMIGEFSNEVLVTSLIELWDREMYKKIFELIKNKVHLKYIDKEFDKAKKTNITMYLTYSAVFSSLDYSMNDFGVSFQDLVIATREFRKEEFTKYVEYILDESNCMLIVPVPESDSTI